ncbi:HD-GYP domain-containing protein [Photobacterium angustum]|uniref:HD domain-containing protein n=1 Tax=Photobacterium angustum TaxID=661 RepID=A0ABX5H2B5_PHOAN|nr:HD domain-containing phosphohydrolase [Photobacterium angustum]PSX07088.1 HD domain-containing protein [Photobacterium angustum]
MHSIIFGEHFSEDDQVKADHIEDTIIDLLVALTSTIETPLVDTVYKHNNRCGEIVSILLKNLNLHSLNDTDRNFILNTPKAAKYMAVASKMHDIGKSQTPSHLLMQPSRLTNAEFAMVREHTTQPTEMLFEKMRYRDNVFVKILEDCVRYHHESFNGCGYPDQLAGDDIPLVGRLMAVSDTFDNLINKTVYAGAMTFDEAKEIIISQSGIRFDPKIVESFLASESQLRILMSDINT